MQHGGQGVTCDTYDGNDGYLDVSDNCPLISNTDQINFDSDEQSSACNLDDDDDGLSDLAEARWKTNSWSQRTRHKTP